jgi:hypothetical protein
VIALEREKEEENVIFVRFKARRPRRIKRKDFKIITKDNLMTIVCERETSDFEQCENCRNSEKEKLLGESSFQYNIMCVITQTGCVWIFFHHFSRFFNLNTIMFFPTLLLFVCEFT